MHNYKQFIFHNRLLIIVQSVFNPSIIMIIICLLFWIPACLIAWIVISDIQDQKQFFSTAITTLGEVVGTMNAQYKRPESPTNQNLAGRAIATNNGKSAGGFLLLVEFSTSTGARYRTKSQQAFSQIPETVEVQYDPKNPSKNRINGYYSNASILGRGIGVAILIAIPFVFHLFFL